MKDLGITESFFSNRKQTLLFQSRTTIERVFLRTLAIIAGLPFLCLGLLFVNREWQLLPLGVILVAFALYVFFLAVVSFYPVKLTISPFLKTASWKTLFWKRDFAFDQIAEILVLAISTRKRISTKMFLVIRNRGSFHNLLVYEKDGNGGLEVVNQVAGYVSSQFGNRIKIVQQEEFKRKWF